MLNRALIIARKEIIDSLRDFRSLLSSLLYSLMGPGVVWMVSLALHGKATAGSAGAVLIGMMSVFTLVAAFVGGTNVAMDMLAGERERRSLLPLLLNPIQRRDVVFGKWMAISFFTTAGLLVNLAGFALTGLAGDSRNLLLVLGFGLIPLALLAGALELAISTICRSIKEAQTYLSMLVFLPMGLGMFLVFNPPSGGAWIHALPVLGQQWLLELWMKGSEIGLLPPLALGLVTVALTAVVLLVAAKRLESDDVVYGN
jgi:sodium transport system permease protein